MSKLSFRARALDAAKPLPVYRSRDLQDLTDCLSVCRTVPQMPTGMDKEEELEHHLQRAISAQHVFREKKESLVIPVPEAESDITDYDRLYHGGIRVPKRLIHMQALGLDLEQPDYDLDSEDEVLLNRLNKKMEIKPLQFETMMDLLEKASTYQLVPMSEAKLLLNEDDYLLKSVYDYWMRKRKRKIGPSLIPRIKQERRDGSTNGDVYVAFRRRTEKMQTRKNRRNVEALYEKMLKLRQDFSQTINILEMIKRREKSKRELLHLTLEVLEKQYHMGDFIGEALRAVSVRPVETAVYNTVPQSNSRKQLPIKHKHLFGSISTKKQKIVCDRLRPLRQQTSYESNINQYDFHSSGDDSFPPQTSSSSDDEENSPDGVFDFKRRAGCQYLSASVPLVGGVSHAGPHPHHGRHVLTEVPPHWMGYSRRRTGRGGRIILDRASSRPMFTPGMCGTNTSDWERLEQSATLTDVLSNIQNVRKFCFRARPVQRPREHSGSTRHEKRSGCALEPDITSAAALSAGGITEAQYHSHQQQLVQMQEHQLLSQRERTPKNLRTLDTDQGEVQTSRTSVSSSRTLDWAGARFAASAVISGACPKGHMMRRSKASTRTCVKGIQHPSGASRPVHSLCGLSVQVSLPPSSPSPHLLPSRRLSPALDHDPGVSSHLTRDPHEPEKLMTMMPMEVT